MSGRWVVIVSAIAAFLLTSCGRSPEKACGAKEVIENVVWKAGHTLASEQVGMAFQSEHERLSRLIDRKQTQKIIKKEGAGLDNLMLSYKKSFLPDDQEDLDARQRLVIEEDKTRKEAWKDFERRFGSKVERAKKLSQSTLNPEDLETLADVCFTNRAKETICLFATNIENIRVKTFDKSTGACECAANCSYTTVNLTQRTKPQEERRSVSYKSEITTDGEPYITVQRF
jgi:hypothetical protein